MLTRNIVLTCAQDEFVESIVRAGEYQDANEAIRDALRVFQQRRQDALRLERLRLHIQAGIDDLENGDFIEISDLDLDAHIEGLDGAGENGSR